MFERGLLGHDPKRLSWVPEEERLSFPKEGQHQSIIH
jgi:hypothetical protein